MVVIIVFIRQNLADVGRQLIIARQLRRGDGNDDRLVVGCRHHARHALRDVPAFCAVAVRVQHLLPVLQVDNGVFFLGVRVVVGGLPDVDILRIGAVGEGLYVIGDLGYRFPSLGVGRHAVAREVPAAHAAGKGKLFRLAAVIGDDDPVIRARIAQAGKGVVLLALAHKLHLGVR